MSSYKGIGPETGKRIQEEDALSYALERVLTVPEDNKEFRKMLVEWFYSGNWLKED